MDNARSGADGELCGGGDELPGSFLHDVNSRLKEFLKSSMGETEGAGCERVESRKTHRPPGDRQFIIM